MNKIQVHKTATLAGHRDCIYVLEGSGESNFFFSAGGDGLVVKWDLANPDIGDLIVRVPNSIYALAYIPQKNWLLVGQNYEGLHWIDLVSQKEIASLKLGNSAIFDIQIFDNQIFVACGDGELIVVDLQTMSIQTRIKVADKSTRCIAICPAWNEFAVGYSDNFIRVFDLKTFALKYSFEAHQNSVFTVQYSPDNRFLLSGSRDAHLKIWDAENHYQAHQSIVAHLYAINHLIYSPNNQYFATCSMDKSIKIWDAQTFKLLKVIDKARHAGHATSVNKLYWSDYQQLLISGSDDRMVSVWEIDF